MSDTVGIKSSDIEGVLGLAEQFLDDWEVADAEQPVSDRSIHLPFRRSVFDAMRPMLLHSGSAIALLERCVDHLDADEALSNEVQDLLALVRIDRYKQQELAMQVASMQIPLDAWRAVFEDGLQAGAHWRPNIQVDAPLDGRDAYYWRDIASDDDENGPYDSVHEMIASVLAEQTIDERRLTRHCDLDNVTARAVMSYEATENAKRQTNAVEMAP